MNEPWQEKDYTHYTLLFVFACIIYSIIGFSWGVIVGMLPDLRAFINNTPHGHLIMLGHGHINLLGWVEMAIFAAIYFLVPRLVRKPIYSFKLVVVHFWLHNFGLLGMVVAFVLAGVLGGMAVENGDPVGGAELVRKIMPAVGGFGTLVLIANIIWGYNIVRTASGWRRTYAG